MKLAALGESATCTSVLVAKSSSQKWLGVLKTPHVGGGGGVPGGPHCTLVAGLPMTSTLPLGNSAAGPSGTEKW